MLNFWPRKAQSYKQEERLIALQYAKTFVKRHKTDTVGAAATVEAVARAHMNFVPLAVAQQDVQTILRNRRRHVETKTQIVNNVRGF